jgi:hypothetical protein
MVVTQPSISGDTAVGSTLTASPGTWSDPAATFTYTWEHCDDGGTCTAIGGAAGATYGLGSDDVGFRIKVVVTAANAGGMADADSTSTAPVTAPVPVPPAPNGVPTVSGDPVVGLTLTADPGQWTDPAASFAYVWQRCDASGSCSAIAGAVGSTYTLTAGDLAATIRVEVTATNVAGTIGTADSSAVGPVVLPAPPAVLTPPSVSGDATVGSTLSADFGSWSDPAATLTSVWQRCDSNAACTAIGGAAANSYTLTAADLGATVRFEVTATNAGGTSIADSASTDVVALPALPTVVTAPSLNGDATVGATLTVDPGTWAGPPPSFAYTWHRCNATGACTAIVGARGNTYTIGVDDTGFAVRAEVTAANATGTTSAQSTPSAVVSASTTTSASPASTTTTTSGSSVGSAPLPSPGTGGG